MSFALPLALLGLALALGPLLAHLVRRQELPTYRLPTAQLLARAAAKSQRRHRFQDLLLLIVRLVGLGLLVLGAAAPFAWVDPARGDGMRESLVIVLDDSMSMRRRVDTDSSALDESIARVREVAGALPAGSEVSLVLAGAPPRAVLVRSAGGEGLAAALAAIPASSARGTDLPGALALARTAFAGSDLRRRLWIVSDFPSDGAELSLPARQEVLGERAPGTDDPASNLALVATSIAPDARGGLVVRAELEFTGATPLETPVALELQLAAPGSPAIAEAALTLEAGSTPPLRRTVDLHIAPDAALPLAANVSVRGASPRVDALPDDNRRGVLLGSASGVRVLLVDGELGATRQDDETAFFARALDAASYSADAPPISYQRVDAERLDATLLSESDVVVLANARPLEARVRRALVDWVEAGGGLLVSAGARFDPVAFNGGFREILPARADAPVALAPPAGVGFQLAAPLPARGFSAARVTRHVPLAPRADAEVWGTLAGGAPLVVARAAEKGRVAILGTTLDQAWADLPLHPGFPALAAALVQGVVAAERANDRRRAPGETVFPPDGANALVRPDGSVLEITPGTAGLDASELRVEEPGAYLFRDDSRELDAFVLAPPAGESQLAPGPVPEARANAEGSASVTPAGRYPLERWLFLLAGLVLLAEGVLRRRRP